MAQKKIAFKCVPGSATISERDSRQSIFVVLSGLTQSDTKADHVEDGVRQFYQITDAMAENVVTLSSVKLLMDCFLKIVQQTTAVNSNLLHGQCLVCKLNNIVHVCSCTTLCACIHYGSKSCLWPGRSSYLETRLLQMNDRIIMTCGFKRWARCRSDERRQCRNRTDGLGRMKEAPRRWF